VVYGSRFSRMETSQGTQLGKGKGPKANASKERIFIAKFKESGQKEREDAKKRMKGLREVHPTSEQQRGNADLQSNLVEDCNDEEWDQRQEKKDNVHRGLEKRPTTRVKKSKLYESPENVNIEIVIMKPPFKKLTLEDFTREYNL